MRVVHQLTLSPLCGAALLALLYGAARLIPPVGLLLYFPTVVGLEILEDRGLATLQGSPDGWPIPTNLGLWISGVSWWLLFSLVFFVYMQVKQRRSRHGGGAI